MNSNEWRSSGEFKIVSLGGKARRIFTRKLAASPALPWLTLLHGFPTCSWDYSKIIPALQTHFNIITFDFLGFGLSDKPKNHAYSIFEQADLVETLLVSENIKSTVLVGHDYAVTVIQELLARRSEDRFKPGIESVILLNGGIYPDLHRPLLIQKLLANRFVGSVVSRLITERAFKKNIRRTFSSFSQVEDRDLTELWKFMNVNNGNLIYDRLIHYISDRRANTTRWVRAIESADIPLAFIWGLDDPISGESMFSYLKARMPHARFIPLENCGHFPQLEAPASVSNSIGSLLIT